jgi:hypothetical protein
MNREELLEEFRITMKIIQRCMEQEHYATVELICRDVLRTLVKEEESVDELKECVHEFFTKYLNRVEESDSGREFNPITIGCCRALMMGPLNQLLERMRVLSGAKPNPCIDGAKVGEVGVWGDSQALAEPVLYMDSKRMPKGTPDWKPGMVFPKPKREWVGLTDADIAKAMHGSVEGSNMLPYQFARAIEQALKEKNT